MGHSEERVDKLSVTCLLQAVDPAAEESALKALARATTAPMISKTLGYALSPAVRSQDVSALLVGLAKQGGLGFNMTWEFILNKADDIQAKYGGGEPLRVAFGTASYPCPAS